MIDCAVFPTWKLLCVEWNYGIKDVLYIFYTGSDVPSARTVNTADSSLEAR
jgi:hypothetical protein